MSRILAIDWGEKRIGLAISDEERSMAFPFRTLANEGIDRVSEAIRHICDAEKVGLILVGVPLTGKGEEGHQAKVVKEFVEHLRRTLLPTRQAGSVPVLAADERFSTHLAERELRLRAGKRRDRSEGIVDQHAAQIILQDYLDRMKKE